jgi:hypothetical protein
VGLRANRAPRLIDNHSGTVLKALRAAIFRLHRTGAEPLPRLAV